MCTGKLDERVQSLSTSLILITSPISPKLYHSKIVKSMLIDECMDKVIKLRLSYLDLVDKTLYLYLLLRSQLTQTQLSDGRTPASNVSKIIVEKKKEKNEEFN